MKAIYNTEEIWYLLADNCAQWSHRDKGKFSSKKNGKRKLEQIFVRFLKLPQLTKCCDFWAVQATNFTRPFMFFCSVEMSPESITPNWVLSPRPAEPRPQWLGGRQMWAACPLLCLLLLRRSDMFTVALFVITGNRAANGPSVFTITEKAPTRAFSMLKVPNSTFTFKIQLRH